MEKRKTEETRIVIKPPNFALIKIPIRGTAPLALLRFSQKTAEKMRAVQEAGSTARSKKKREPKDFGRQFVEAQYLFSNGGYGFPASAIRTASISACRTVGFKMTLAKLSLFVEPDGFDAIDQTPLIRITKGIPKEWVVPVRNTNGSVDLRMRPRWNPGWEATLQIRYDADQFTAGDVANLIARVGMQVGIGEGRPDSKQSCGIGFGHFEVVDKGKSGGSNGRKH